MVLSVKIKLVGVTTPEDNQRIDDGLSWLVGAAKYPRSHPRPLTRGKAHRAAA